MAERRFCKQANIIPPAASEKPETAKHRCGLCDSSGKVGFTCKQCQVSLCSNCRTAHARIQTTRDHNVHPLVDQKGQNQKGLDSNGQRTQWVSEFCKKHPKEELKLYCKECEEAICHDCITSLHNRHDCEKASVVFEKKKKKINDILLTLNNEYKSEIDSLVTDLHKQRDEYEEQTENLATKVRQRETTIKKNVGKVTESILSEFEKTWTLNRKTIDQYLATAEKFASEIKSGNSTHSDVTGKQPFTDVVCAEKHLSELLQRIELFVNKQCPTLQTDSFFYEEDLDTQRIEILFGRHENDSLYSSDFEECGNTPVFEVKIKTSWSYTVGPIVAICPQDSHILFSIKMTQLEKPLYAVLMYNTAKRTTKKLYQLKPLIADMTVLKDGRILATKPEEQKVYQLTDDGKLKDFLDTKPFSPYGISVSQSTGDLLLALNTERSKGSIDDDRHSVVRLSDDGKVKQNIEFSHDHKPIFMEPFKAIELSNEKICVIDVGTHNIKFVNACGEVESTYSGNSDSESFYPNDIGCDRNGNVVIADADSKVHLISQSGQFIQYLMTENVPQTIVFDTQDNLLVGCGNGQAFLISYKKNDKS